MSCYKNGQDEDHEESMADWIDGLIDCAEKWVIIGMIVWGHRDGVDDANSLVQGSIHWEWKWLESSWVKVESSLGSSLWFMLSTSMSATVINLWVLNLIRQSDNAF